MSAPVDGARAAVAGPRDSCGEGAWWEWSVAGLLLCALFSWSFSLHVPKPGYDLYWFLHLGRTMVESGHIPHTESFLNTAPLLPSCYWLNDEWGFELAAYGTWSLAGYAGLALAKALIICGTFGLLLASCRRVGMAVVPACAWLTLVAWMMAPRFTPRPHLVTDLCLAFLVWMLLRWERGRGPHVACVLPLFAVWANIHAGVTTGLGVLGIWLVGEAIARDPRMVRRVAQALGLACLGTLLSPQGPGMLHHLVAHATSPAMGMIDEWAPIGHDWWRTGYGVFVYATVLGFGGACLARRRCPGDRAGEKEAPRLDGVRAAHVLVTLILVLLAARYNRVVNELGAVAAPLVAAGLVECSSLWRGGAGSGRKFVWCPRMVGMVLVGVAVPLVVRFPPPASAYEPDRSVLPVEAVRFMQRHPLPGRLYNTYHFGGFLLWCGVPPFIHGCPPLYGDELLQDYVDLAIRDEATRSRLLEKYGIRSCLLDWRRHPRIFTGLIIQLARDPAWRLVYWDDGAVLMARADAGVALPEPYRAVNPGLPEPFTSTDPARVRADLERKLREDPACEEARRLLLEWERRYGSNPARP